MCNDVDILTGVQANMRRHDGQEDMATASQVGYGDGLSFQVTERADPVDADQLYATWMKTGQDYNWVAVVHLGGERPTEVSNDIHFAGGKGILDSSGFDILHISEPLATQEILCHI
jgi:hypothetical protein